MGAIDIALAAAQSKRRRRPDPIADIAAAVGLGAGIPSAVIGEAIGAGATSSSLASASPTYQPRAIASRRESAFPERVRALRTSAPRPGERKRPARRTTAQKRRPTLLEHLDRPFAPGEQITPRQTALLAEAFGLPGRTYSKAIVPGESNFQPGVPNPDDGTPSLFQITPSVQSDATRAKFDQIASRHKGGYSNPVAAAKQAAFLARGSANEGVSNYVAFNPSAPQGHLRGGAERARKILGMPAPKSASPPPMQKLTKFLPGGERDDYRKTDPKLLRRALKVARESGDPIEINSGYRSRAEQQALYDAYLAGTGNLAAPPGSSNHEGGTALDLNMSDAQRALLGKYGLGLPVPGEDWHVELNEGTGYSAVSGGGSDVSYGSGAAVANGIMGAATQDRNRAQSTYRRTGPLSTTPFAARALTPAERKRLKDEEEIDPETGLPVEKRYAPRRRRG